MEIGGVGSGAGFAGGDLEWRLFSERHDVAEAETRWALFDRMRDGNIVADEGSVTGMGTRYVRTVGLDPAHTRWLVDVRGEGGVGSFGYGRLFGDVTVSRPLLEHVDGALTLGAGSSVGTVPAQRHFYLGGPFTVRGQDPGAGVGDAYWLARAEIGRAIGAPGALLRPRLGRFARRLAHPGRPPAARARPLILDGLIRFECPSGIYPGGVALRLVFEASSRTAGDRSQSQEPGDRTGDRRQELGDRRYCRSTVSCLLAPVSPFFMWREFKAFLLKQNLLALALAVVVGTATNGVVQSLVNGFIMPLVGLMTPGAGWRQWRIPLGPSLADRLSGGGADSVAAAATVATGATGGTGEMQNALLVGELLASLLNFLIVAFVAWQITRLISSGARRHAARHAAVSVLPPADRRDRDALLVLHEPGGGRDGGVAPPAGAQTSIVPSQTSTELPPTRTAVTAPRSLSASTSRRLGRPISIPCATVQRSVAPSRGVRAAR